MKFWDSSALVPLIVRQDGSAKAEEWLAADPEVVMWTLTFVELVSALRRLVREGSLHERAALEAEAVAAELVPRAHVVADVEGVKAIACRLLRVHPLRSADALQLGAALAWADGRPAGHVLQTLDRKLGLAAEREGFIVTPQA
jgi:predicted nucleic acid-binding protein